MESDIEGAFADYAETKGCMAYKFVSPNRVGVPDRMVSCPDDLIFFIEFKSPGEPLKPWQDREITRMRERGHSVYVCDNLSTAKKILNYELRTRTLSRNRGKLCPR
jgi:hypothetical protein